MQCTFNKETNVRKMHAIESLMTFIITHPKLYSFWIDFDFRIWLFILFFRSRISLITTMQIIWTDSYLKKKNMIDWTWYVKQVQFILIDHFLILCCCSIFCVFIFLFSMHLCLMFARMKHFWCCSYIVWVSEFKLIRNSKYNI